MFFLMTTLFAKLPTLVWLIKISSMDMEMLKRYLNLEVYTATEQLTQKDWSRGSAQLFPALFSISLMNQYYLSFQLKANVYCCIRRTRNHWYTKHSSFSYVKGYRHRNSIIRKTLDS